MRTKKNGPGPKPGAAPESPTATKHHQGSYLHCSRGSDICAVCGTLLHRDDSRQHGVCLYHRIIEAVA